MRLAAAIDPRPDELADLLLGALSDARPALFFATVAHAAALDFDTARAIALDPEGDRLWLVPEADGFDRILVDEHVEVWGVVAALARRYRQ